jgi:exopolysaccharide biosynthesis predicted pyruvyltransferase EpsI/cellulose synthase/poly-beta-1,6-N-acetylglucosamine synthase-like glycosyltransferase
MNKYRSNGKLSMIHNIKNNILVSVVVPIFNVGKYLGKCLDSICSQTLKNIEIICVYTDSSDNTLEILQAYIKEDNRIRMVRRDDGGLGGARNYGLSLAQGEYIAFVDSDDWIAEKMFENMYNIAKYDNTDIVICAINSYDDIKGKFIENDWGYNIPFSHSLDGIAFTYIDIESEKFISDIAPVTAWNKIYRKHFLDKNQLSFPENIRYEDNPFYYEAMIKAEKVRFTRKRYYYYRKNRKGSLQDSGFTNNNMLDIINIFAIIHCMLEKNCVSGKVKAAAINYISKELTWRFLSLKGHKRKFLQAVRKICSEYIYESFIKKLHTEGTRQSDAIISKSIGDMVKVSIIIPVYNKENYLAACLNSALTQTMNDLEVICVNDASDDNSLKILLNYRVKDHRIKIVENQKNSGPGISRELALRLAVGEFVFFLDADDMFASNDILELMYNTCIKNDVYVCGGNIICLEKNNISYVSNNCAVFDKEKKISYKQYLPHPTWGFSRFLYNLEIIVEKNISFGSLRFYEDPLFLVSYMSHAEEFFTINRPVYIYRMHSNHHCEYTYQQWEHIFISQKLILPILEVIDCCLYYAEYDVFLSFCRKFRNTTVTYPDDSAKLISLCDSIFNNMNFSKASCYLDKHSLYNSYHGFVNAEFINNDTNKRIVKNMKKSIKKILKFILGPFYRACRNRIHDIIRSENLILKYALLSEISKIKPDILSKISNIKPDILSEMSQKYQFDFLNGYIIANSIISPKIFLVDTPEHPNIGDAAIACGEYEFIRKYYANYKIVEVSDCSFEQRYKQMRAIISNDDIIFIHGGGNLGTLYLHHEQIRRRVLSDYPNNKTVILPQTIYFSEDIAGHNELKVSVDIYNQHKKLVLLTRGLKSLEFARKHFTNARCANALDAALMLNGKFSFDRKGILLCVRDLADESGFNQEEYNLIHEIIFKIDREFCKSNNIHESSDHSKLDIPQIIRRPIVDDEIKLFAKHKIVVTDRLHGLIFAILTHTPCILLSAYNQKISEFSEQFHDSNAIFFLDKNLNKIEDAVHEAMLIKNPVYPILDRQPFDMMHDFITKSFMLTAP